VVPHLHDDLPSTDAVVRNGNAVRVFRVDRLLHRSARGCGLFRHRVLWRFESVPCFCCLDHGALDSRSMGGCTQELVDLGSLVVVGYNQALAQGMKTKFIEATNGPRNWGKFLVGQFTPEEWALRSQIDPGRSLIGGRGWHPKHRLVLDLQTGEGAIFLPGGLASADLHKHKIWVCPLFEPFLEWLYKQDLSDIDALPAHVDLPNAEFMMSGYRRQGPAPSRGSLVVPGNTFVGKRSDSLYRTVLKVEGDTVTHATCMRNNPKPSITTCSLTSMKQWGKLISREDVPSALRKFI
jgi:hypothetical protein